MSAGDSVRFPQPVSDLDRRHARALVTNVEQAQKALAAYGGPTLGVQFRDGSQNYDDPRDAGPQFVCPWCEKATDVVSRDAAERETPAADANMYAEVVTFDYDDGPDWEGVGYFAVCCDLPVSLPAGWEEV